MPPFRRYTLKQLFHYITWMCVGFAGMSFSMRRWNLPLNPEWDPLANLEPVARVAALVVGWVIVCAAAICLVTTQRRGAVLIAALLSMFPGAFVGAGIAYGLFGHGPALDVGVFGGAILAAAIVILGAIVPARTVKERSVDKIPEPECPKTSL